MSWSARLTLVVILAAGCNGGRGGGIPHDTDGPGVFDLSQITTTQDFAGTGDTDGGAAYPVYACSDSELYLIDLTAKTLVDVGPFNTPKVGGSADVITDLAVSPTGVIYVISHTTLYTASPMTGAVTSVGAVTTCGSDNVALSFTNDAKLYAADYSGNFCEIGYMSTPLTLTKSGPIGGGMAIAGDIVAIDNGTMYGTALDLTDGGSASPTAKNNLLIKIDPSTGMSTQVIGSTGYPELYGVAYALGQVFGFTHDGSGDVITIDPSTGVGTPFNTFKDPTSMKGIAFAGAGVNSMVPPIQ
jgi:hypothetical protein